jgi:hypothetical protein
MSAATCLRHPGLPAADRCPRCGAPFCAGCGVVSLGAERTYCSEDCRDLEAGIGRALPASASDLARGAESPIRLGWALAFRSFPTVLAHLLPVALGMALLLWYGGATIAEVFEDNAALPSHLGLAGWALFGYGAALTAVLLSREHTSFAPGNPYLWTLRRFAPWALTWLLIGVIVLFGFVLLIIPGILLGIRLFWADEYALVLESGPVRSIRDSWNLTRGRGWRIFSFQFLLGLAEYLIVLPGVALIAGIHVAAGATGFGSHAAVQIVASTAIFAVAFLTYATVHGPEVTYFYGLRAVEGQQDADPAAES